MYFIEGHAIGTKIFSTFAYQPTCEDNDQYMHESTVFSY